MATRTKRASHVEADRPLAVRIGARLRLFPLRAAVLAVGSVIPRPVVVGGEVKVADRMRVTLSADHRVIDGAVAARFLQRFKLFLEQPLHLVS